MTNKKLSLAVVLIFVALMTRLQQSSPSWAAAMNAGQQRHWAFVRPARPASPQVKNKSWLRTPIDQFVLARLEREGLTPSPEADRVTLLRRLSLDLIGLPPTVAEVDAFLNDKS